MADPAPAPTPAAAPDTSAPAAAPVNVNPQAPAAPAAEPVWTGAPDPTSAAPAPSTALDSPAAPVSPAAIWPDDWRQKMVAGVPDGDERTKALNLLQRMTDPEMLVKKLREQDRLISAGSVRKAPGADATPEALAAYRAEIGVPDKPEGYYEKLTDGLVIGEDDKPLVDLFFQNMHTENASPAIVQKAVDAFYQIQEQAQEQFIREQTVVKETTVDALRAKWGGEFRPNMNGISNLFDGFFGEISDQMKLAILPDGTPVMNHLKALEGFAALSRELNPGAAVIPAGAGNVAQSVDSEIAKIEEAMAKPGGWNAHMRNPAQNARYGQLLEAREKMKARGQR